MWIAILLFQPPDLSVHYILDWTSSFSAQQKPNRLWKTTKNCTLTLGDNTQDFDKGDKLDCDKTWFNLTWQKNAKYVVYIHIFL